ncbi:MAG: GNAT family N-acetyltransferase [Acutalibacter sp.]
MTIQRLEREEAHRLYWARFREDFVPSELRPWGSILRLMDQGAYAIFACKEAGEILAYATFIQCPGALLLDYFAVDPARRGQGVGTAFFHGLQKLPALGQASCLYIEAESLESAPTPRSGRRAGGASSFTPAVAAWNPWYAYLLGWSTASCCCRWRGPSPGRSKCGSSCSLCTT